MANQLSPGILTRELDLTAVVPQISTTDGAVIGEFQWGAVEQVAFISSEDLLAEGYGRPSDDTFLSFFTAANFLAYGNKLQLVRVIEPTITSETNNAFSGTDDLGGAVTSGGFNSSDGRRSVIDLDGTVTAYNDRRTVKNIDDFETRDGDGEFDNNDDLGHFLAKYPGQQGDSLKVSICPSAAAFGGNLENLSSILQLGILDFDQGDVGVGFTDATITADAANLIDFREYLDAINASNPIGETITLFGAGVVGTPTFIITNITEKVLTVTPTDADPGTVQATVTGVGGSANQSTGGSTVTKLQSVGNAVDFSTFITGGTVITVGNEQRTVSVVNGVGGTLINVSEEFDTLTELELQVTGGISYEWEYAGSFDSAPGTSDYVGNVNGSNDELHLIVVDEGGLFTGSQGTVLETWPFLSKASDAKAVGVNNFYLPVLNRSSRYVYILSDNSDFAPLFGEGLAAGTVFGDGQIVTSQLTDGNAGAAQEPTASSLITGYNIFNNADTFNVSLMMMGAPAGLGGDSGKYVSVIQNAIGIAEQRKDFVLFFSPAFPDVGSTETDAEKAQLVVDRKNSLNLNSSYAFMDSGWKYQYDKYNDVFRNVPLNGDTAGVCVRSDIDRDPWFSPAGFNRGQIRNVVRLPFSPGRPERDTLYRNSVNPITTFTGEGTVLFGDKTLLSKPNAFDRINVRRLFIILEKTIASAALTTLFEFNDQFTRQQFVNLIEPFLRQVQGRSGISDFRIICDDTNNTAQIIDTNNFVASVFVKPARSINFITLNFVSVNSGVEFDEVVGAV